MKSIIKIAGVICFLVFGIFEIQAVTDKDMEQARTIAAKAYLRYANNGSGYLDDQKPTTMAELRKGLKAKEIENLKTFTAVASPKDYASWDKDKLVEYWAVTFFKSGGLIEAGKGARGTVRKQVSAMSVSAPAAPSAKETPKETQKDAPKEAAASEDKSNNLPVSLVDDESQAKASTDMAADLERTKQEADSIAALVAADTGSVEEPKKKSNGTWIYISILIALIAAVIWLVVYASKTMNVKNNEKEKVNPGSMPQNTKTAAMPTSREKKEVEAGGVRNDSALKSEFAQTVARKNEEIRLLNEEMKGLDASCRELEEANRHLQGENARLVAELETTRHENNELKGELARIVAESRAARQQVEAVGQTTHPEAAARRVSAPVAEHRPVAKPKRSIYLGRVNARGLFVRADRTLNVDGSVYLIETEDGYSGSFRVVNVPEVCERVLTNPTQWLAGGCVSADLLSTAGMTEIHTEATGEAVFESGCWRVVKKAKISYK